MEERWVKGCFPDSSSCWISSKENETLPIAKPSADFFLLSGKSLPHV